MDSGSRRLSSAIKSGSRGPLQEQFHHRRKSSNNLDRFIPNPAALDIDYAHFMVMGGKKGKENWNACSSPWSDSYQERLAEIFNMNRTRIFSFKDNPPVPIEPIPSFSLTKAHWKPAKPQRFIPQSCDLTLDAPDMKDDYYLNLLDWGPSNVVAIALDHTVFLWNASDKSTSELVTADEEDGPVTSVRWASDGRHIAIGLNNSHVQIWDSVSSTQLRTLRGGHRTRVGSMAWNSHILSTGDMEGIINNNDIRVRSHTVDTYAGHILEICSLEWSPSGRHLASGGNDNLVLLWDRSGSGSERWVYRLEDHGAAVRALAWCPLQSNLLATGGGELDRCIKVWNTATGVCLNSVNTGSQVCGLAWSKGERELLSSQGFSKNRLDLWKYPSMTKIVDLEGLESRLLYMAQSPDGRTLATAGGDERLRFWNVFRPPKVEKRANPEPFSNLNRIR